MNATHDIGIVGGGVLGLTMGLRLAERGHRVSVYEAGPSIGGLARSADLGAVRWDRFYHVCLQSDEALLGLLGDLGLRDDMVWRATGTGLYHDGSLFPVSTAMDYVRLPALGPIAKARIAATVLRAASTNDWASLERMTAEEWLSRWSGAPAYRTFWRPLLRAKLGDRYSDVSAAFIWAIIQRLYAARRAGMKQDLFGYMPGGYATILDALSRSAAEAGVHIRTSTPVQRVASSGRMVELQAEGSPRHDRVVVTVPSPVAARLVPGLSAEERRMHQAIDYQGVVCVALVTDRPVMDYYVTNITDERSPFTGIIDMTALVDPEEFGGHGLVYLPMYAAPDAALHDEDEATIVERATAGLAKMVPGFTADRVAAASVGRARYVLPLSTVGYSRRVPPMQSSVDGIWIVNSAHILNGTLNVNETVQLADRGVAAVLREKTGIGV